MSAAPIEVNAGEAHEFLTNLFAVAEEGWVSLFSSGPDGSVVDWAPVTDPGLAAGAAISRAQELNVWVGLATRREKLGRGQRGGVKDCLAVPALWADIDIAGPNHATTMPLPETDEDALALVEALGLAPSIVVHSGGGLHVYWLFAEMQDVGELVAADVFVRWQATLERLAGERGWHIDNVSNPDRVMRVPGTCNLKQATEGVVTSARIMSADYALRYGLDDIMEHLDPAPEAEPWPLERPSVPYVGPERPGDAFAMKNTGGDVLRSFGFTLVRTAPNRDEFWRRPGSSSGHSAVVHVSGQTAIFSSTVVAQYPALKLATDPGNPTYNAFSLYTAMAHGGDFSAATKALVAQGYGTPAAPDDLSWVGAGAPAATEEESEDPDAPWPVPESFDPAISHGPRFPLSVLPAWMADHVAHTAYGLSAPTDYAAISGLGVLSALVMNRLTLTITGTDRPRMGVNLYLVAAGTSGAMKSPSFSAMAGVLINQIIPAREEQATEARIRAEGDLRNAERALADLEKRPTSSPGAPTAEDLYNARLEIEAAKSAIPAAADFLADDATPEALAVHVKDCGEIAAVFSPEGELIEIVVGQYTDKGKAPNLGIYIKSYDGERYAPKRIGRESFKLTSPRMTICVMTQPGILAKMGQHATLTDKGLVPRFLMAVPANNTGWVNHSQQLRRSPAASHARQVYEEAVLDLDRRLGRRLTPLAVETSPEVTQAYVDWAQGIEERMRKGGDLRSMEAWIRKLVTATLRTAALLHVVHGHDDSEPISMGTWQRATVLADYWIAHAKVIYAAWADARRKANNGDADLAQKILQWAVDEGLDEVEWTKIRRRLHDSHGLKVADCAPVVEYLVDTGWARVPAGFWDYLKGNTRGKPSPIVTFHPDAALHLAGEWDEAPDLGLPPNAPILFEDSSTTLGERVHWGNGGNTNNKSTTTTGEIPSAEREIGPERDDSGQHVPLTPIPPMPPNFSTGSSEDPPESSPEGPPQSVADGEEVAPWDEGLF